MSFGRYVAYRAGYSAVRSVARGPDLTYLKPRTYFIAFLLYVALCVWFFGFHIG